MLHYHGGGGLRLCQQPVAPMALGVRNSSLAELKLEDVFFAPVATAVARGGSDSRPLLGSYWTLYGHSDGGTGGRRSPRFVLLCAGS